MQENKIQSRDYPLDEVQYELLPSEKKIIVQKLCYLFVFYAAKGSKHAYY